MGMFIDRNERKRLRGTSSNRISSSAGGKSAKVASKVSSGPSTTLSIQIESPPLVFYGTTAQSTGALLSGQVSMTTTLAGTTLDSFTMTLSACVTSRRPLVKDCLDCATRSSELFRWTFLRDSKCFAEGQHSIPFSYLLPGHLPATSASSLGRLEYVLLAQATEASTNLITETTHVLHVGRALVPSPDKTSIRIFPPTNLTATIVFPSIVHPSDSFMIQMRLSGVIDKTLVNGEPQQRRWRIRKLNWRIEEHLRIVSAVCPRHAHRIGGEGKGILHNETRILGCEDLRTGWKTDYDVVGGSIEVEFLAKLRSDLNAVCDVASTTGLSSYHDLTLEAIVAEEQTSMSKQGKQMSTPTGAARILRMQFKLIVSDRAGMGISWDEEMPPMYEDVPDSPPGYIRVDDYVGDLSRLNL